MGEFKDGKFNGLGICIKKSGDFKCGNWKNSKFVQGFGRLNGKDDSDRHFQYIGTFTGSKRDGSLGVLKVGCSDNKLVYGGSFKNGKKHGYGKETWPNGDVYEGEFKKGFMDGFGEF